VGGISTESSRSKEDRELPRRTLDHSHNLAPIHYSVSQPGVWVNMDDRNEDDDKDKDTKDTKDHSKDNARSRDKEIYEGKTDIEDHKFLSKINPKNVSAVRHLTLILNDLALLLSRLLLLACRLSLVHVARTDCAT